MDGACSALVTQADSSFASSRHWSGFKVSSSAASVSGETGSATGDCAEEEELRAIEVLLIVPVVLRCYCQLQIIGRRCDVHLAHLVSSSGREETFAQNRQTVGSCINDTALFEDGKKIGRALH